MSQLRFLWHSHGVLPVGWSTPDDNTARNVFGADADWTVNLVVNVYGHLLARMDFPRDQEPPVNGLNINLELPVYHGMEKGLAQDYDEKHPHKVSLLVECDGRDRVGKTSKVW